MEYQIVKNQFHNHDIDVIILKNEAIEVHVTSLGCTVIAILTKDNKQQFGDVLLGFDDMELYEKQDKYLGAIVGRCAGRIKGAGFALGDEVYTLPKNNGENCLHGGIGGFHTKVFDYEIRKEGIRFHYVSKDMEEGFPGELDVYITYEIDGSKLVATYEADTNKDTVVNITNHMYFNLAGQGTVLRHILQVHADAIICSDEDCCANGTYLPVRNTPFDFTVPKEIGKDIDKVHKQLEIGGGYDHYYVFNQTQPNVILNDPKSGRTLKVSSNQKGCQIYTANFLDGTLKGKNGWFFDRRDAICVETQAAPNAIHTEVEPSTILRKGEHYLATTTYTFEVEKEEQNHESE